MIKNIWWEYIRDTGVEEEEGAKKEVELIIAPNSLLDIINEKYVNETILIVAMKY